MKTKISPAIVGLFVLGAFALGLIALLSFGSLNLLSRPQRFLVTFNESIHGLDLGSPVKFRGVRVGRVAAIQLRYNQAANESLVDVVCELARDTMTDAHSEPIDLSDRGQLQDLIDRGLRAQLGVIGLATGLLYVELEMRNPAQFPAPTLKIADGRYAVVPSTPSTIAEFQASLTEILASVKKVDFPGLATEFRGLLTDSRRQVSTLDLAPLVTAWTAAGTSINTLVSSGQISGALDNLNGTLTELSGTLAKIDTAVEPTTAELAATLQQAQTTLAAFEEAAGTAQRFINAQSGLGREAALALQQLGQASAAIARLADFLERNPTALLSGRPPE